MSELLSKIEDNTISQKAAKLLDELMQNGGNVDDIIDRLGSKKTS